MAARSKKFFSGIVKPFFGGRRPKDGKEDEEDLEAIAATEQRVFRYETLATATSNFSPKNKLGEGGFGPVYKGRLEDGREVAVKRLGRGSRQGAREFENEALLLSRVQHKNVVNLYGYCSHGDDKLLVYEYVPNESLDKLLFSREEEVGRRKRKVELDWARRYKVIIGVARGLLYLHESAQTTIIHRDIKASNILLDGRWTPKIADFGMARLFPEDQTHINTRVAGTNGYMAPEYVMHGILSVKADVFSFGVLLLELVAGRKNSAFASVNDPDVDNLLEWAWKLYKKGQSMEVLDPALSPAISGADAEHVAMCIQVGLLCTQADPKQRPDMNRVLAVLSKITTTTTLALEEPMEPGIPGRRYRRRSHGLTTTHTLGSTAADAAGESSSASSATTSSTPTTTTCAARPVHRSLIHRSRFHGSGVGGAGICGRRGGDHASVPYAPGPGRPPPRAHRRRPQRPEAAPRGGAVLSLPPRRHLLEVRDAADLRAGARLHPFRARPPPEVHHEEPAQCPPHRLGAPPLLAPLLRHRAFGPHQPAQPAHRQSQTLRVNTGCSKCRLGLSINSIVVAQFDLLILKYSLICIVLLLIHASFDC